MHPTAFEIGIAVNGWILTEYSPEEECIVSFTYKDDEKLLEVLRKRLALYRDVANSQYRQLMEGLPAEDLNEEELPACLQNVCVTEDAEASRQEFENSESEVAAPPKEKKRRRVRKKNGEQGV